jgi:hypothetical protein
MSSVSTATIAQETRAGDGFFAAGEARERLETREQRALKLYREHGDEIEQVASNLYWVPGQDGRCEYVLRYPVAVGEQGAAPVVTTNSGARLVFMSSPSPSIARRRGPSATGTTSLASLLLPQRRRTFEQLRKTFFVFPWEVVYHVCQRKGGA